MIPILYAPNEVNFTHNGITPLFDVISCKCTEKLNSSYELELKIPRNSQYIKSVQTNCIIKAKPNYEDPPQLFRIYSVEKNYDDHVGIKAAHIAYDTAGMPILPFVSESLYEAVDYMNTNRLLSDSPFLLNATFEAEGHLSVEVPSSFRSLLSGSDNSIVGVYKGEYHYDNYIINLLEKRGRDKGICFRYGKNISDFEHEVDSEKLYTAVIGYWKKSEQNNQNNIIYGNLIHCAGLFPYEKVYILDTSSEIQTENGVDATVDQIDEVVEKYISDNAVGMPQCKMKIDYVDDDKIVKICLGDRVGVVYPEYDIYAVARCNTVVFDSLNEENESIEIGVNAEDISDTISNLI